MKDVLGIIDLADNDENLRELTPHRSVAAIPFGGRYRLIDFVLSNMVNAGIRNVAILAQNKYRALADHVGAGKEWDLDRQRDGLFMLPPAITNEPIGSQRGSVQNLHSNLDYIYNSKQNYVVLSGANMVCNLDLTEVVEYHLLRKADITTVYKEVPANFCPHCTWLETSGTGRVLDIEVNPRRPHHTKICLNIFVMHKSLLLDLVDGCVARGESDFVKDGFIKNMHKLKMYGYPFEGYLAPINTLQGYFQYSMDLLKPEVWRELFFKNGLIYTKVKHEAPTQYRNGAQVKNSLIANGCLIEGKVENSILFRGVRVHHDAVLRNSIVMQKSEIGAQTVLENVIVDKDAQISGGKSLIGDVNYPMVIHKRAVI